MGVIYSHGGGSLSGRLRDWFPFKVILPLKLIFDPFSAHHHVDSGSDAFCLLFFPRSTPLLLLRWKTHGDLRTQMWWWTWKKYNVSKRPTWRSQSSPAKTAMLRFGQNFILGGTVTEFHILKVCHTLVSPSPTASVFSKSDWTTEFFPLTETKAPHEENCFFFSFYFNAECMVTLGSVPLCQSLVECRHMEHIVLSCKSR